MQLEARRGEYIVLNAEPPFSLSHTHALTLSHTPSLSQSLPDSLAVLSRLQNILLEANPIAFVSPDSFSPNPTTLRLMT